MASEASLRYEDPDVYDIPREDTRHLAFGYGLQYSLSANLARLESCVALHEVLNRWPEWGNTTTTSGWPPPPPSEAGTACRSSPPRSRAYGRSGPGPGL
jgi:cytochrome P450